VSLSSLSSPLSPSLYISNVSFLRLSPLFLPLCLLLWNNKWNVILIFNIQYILPETLAYSLQSTFGFYKRPGRCSKERKKHGFVLFPLHLALSLFCACFCAPVLLFWLCTHKCENCKQMALLTSANFRALNLGVTLFLSYEKFIQQSWCCIIKVLRNVMTMTFVLLLSWQVLRNVMTITFVLLYHDKY
jgi:hypothetical protein